MKHFNRFISKLMTVPIRFYQWVLSPLWPATCRFYPSCSHYALEALQTHGPVKGLWLSIKRIGKCHPYGPTGCDPVPVKEK